jgi:uncharacterized protein YaiE (UPF0345 family)
MPAVSLKHNSYFDGNVQSIGFERHGRRATAGVIAPGTYHFGTEAPERMTIVSGLLLVRPDANPKGKGDGEGGDRWSAYPAGTSFEIAGHSGFDVRATEPVAYLCEFL